MNNHPIHFSNEQIILAITLVLTAVLLCTPSTIPNLGRLILSMFKLIGLNFTKLKSDSIQIGDFTLTDEDRMRHTHILGATGTGKSVLLEHLLYRDLSRGYGALIIDAKGDRELYKRIKDYCKKIGRERELKYLSATQLEESVRWNPCRLGNSSELQSKFFSSAKYENSFYAKACELALLQAFNKISKQPSLTVNDLASELNQLSNHGKDDNLKGLYFDIQNLASGEWAPIIGTAPKVGNQEEISLLDITRKNDILFVDLPTEGKVVQSARIGALMLQEVTLISGMRKRCPSIKSAYPFSVFIDEFDAFATDPFVSFLNKGRSSEFMIHMAHQTLSDLRKVSPTFEGQVMGNVNNRFIFRIDISEDAEKLSKLFGTKNVTKHTHQTDGGATTGKGSAREVLEFEVHPDTIKKLKTGECVVSIKTAGYLKVTKIPQLTEKNLPVHDLPVLRAEVISEVKSAATLEPDMYSRIANKAFENS